MPQMVVISGPEYVVGTATTGSDEVSAIALPKPMVEPPPMATQQSASTDFAISRPAPTAFTGVCITAWSKTPATFNPLASALTMRARPGVEISSGRFAPRRSTSAASSAARPAPNTTRIGMATYLNLSMSNANPLAVIVGAGSGLSASLARQCTAAGMRVALAARNVQKLNDLKTQTGAGVHACDVTEAKQVEQLFASLDAPDLVVYNPSYRVRGAFLELDREEVKKTLMVSAYGGFLVAQAAVKRMLERARGSLFFTGASASVKGHAESAPFAMGKFALRGLAQSLARELGPKGLHVAHFVIDGGIGRGEGKLDPDALARTYPDVHRQDRSAWTFEVDLRPSVEKF